MICRGNHLEHVPPILARGWRKRSAREGLERTLEHVACRDHPWLLRIAAQRSALIARLLPRHAGHAVVDAKVRARAAMEARRDARTPAERGAQRSVAGLGSHLEVLRLALAEAILDDLGQSAAAELERAERHRVTLTVAKPARPE